MLLQDIFDQLTYGEMSQLSMAGPNTHGIQVQDYPKIIPHINLALTELHKRFNLKESEVVIQQFDEIQTYTLELKYAQTSIPDVVLPGYVSPVPRHYLMDSVYQPFQNDVLRINAVFNELGEELFVNQEDAYTVASGREPHINEGLHNRRNPGGGAAGSNKYWSVHTPTYNTIQVPYPDSSNQMIVTYRAAHPTIPVMDLDPTTYEVNLPITLLESLLLYIGSRVNVNRGTELSLAEGQLFMAKFEASVVKVTELGLMTTNDTQNIKLEMNGWA